MSFDPPPDALGAELVHWREDGTHHTILTIAGPLFANKVGASRVRLTCALYDLEGRFVTSWERELAAGDALFLDSRELSPEPAEGALVVWVSAPDADPELAHRYTRAQTMVDWFSDAGELVSLHTDQSVVMSGGTPVELTEIVFLETASSRTSLVIVNGPESQPPGGLRVIVRNGRGQERHGEYAREMLPYTVHKIALRDLVNDLVDFCGGTEATIAGQFTARGIFTRPYVVTEGEVLSGYHGGNRYPAGSIPGPVHRTFPYAEVSEKIPRELMLVTGQKEMNPAYAVNTPSLTTRLHLFQSHGELDEDFFVDATLYDTTGRLVVHRERWAVAPRRGATTCDIAALVSGASFEGHIALRFSEDVHEGFPRRLQALMEYRTSRSVARVMLWSDRWNAADRLLTQRSYRALYRVYSKGPRHSRLAITNPGVGPDYDREASYVVRLRSVRGEELVYRGTLLAHATKVATIAELFPERFADELVIAIVESVFDLASMHLTMDARTGIVAAEHLIAVSERVGGVVVSPCGA